MSFDQPDFAVLAGFVVREAGRYVPGGLPLGGFLSEEQCLVRCAEIPSCLAVDYNIRNGTCFTHNQNTSCNPLVLRSDFIHHRRVVCSSRLILLFILFLFIYFLLKRNQKGSKVVKWVKIFKTERTLEIQQARLTEACGKV